MFDKQQANTIFWSPQGQFVVLAGLRRWVSAACCCTEHHCGDPDVGPCGSWQLLDTVMGCPCVKGLSPFFWWLGIYRVSILPRLGLEAVPRECFQSVPWQTSECCAFLGVEQDLFLAEP